MQKGKETPETGHRSTIVLPRRVFSISSNWMSQRLQRGGGERKGEEEEERRDEREGGDQGGEDVMLQ